METRDLARYLKMYQSGDVIIKEGDVDRDFFCLVQGSVSIWKGDPSDSDHRVKIGELAEKGTYFGEMGYLLREVRSASIIADDSVKVLKLPGEMLTQMIENQPALGLKICKNLANRLKGTTIKTHEVSRHRKELQSDAAEQLHFSQDGYRKVFVMIMAVHRQFQNPLIKELIEYMAQNKLLQGGKKVKIDDQFLRDIPESILPLVQKVYEKDTYV